MKLHKELQSHSLFILHFDEPEKLNATPLAKTFVQRQQNLPTH